MAVGAVGLVTPLAQRPVGWDIKPLPGPAPTRPPSLEVGLVQGRIMIQESVQTFHYVQLLTVDGGWSSWKPNSTCSVSCGTAFRSLIRDCNNPTPQYGGKQCKGNTTDTEPCSDIPPCPNKLKCSSQGN